MRRPRHQHLYKKKKFHISNTLPQFNHQKALFVVTGRDDAEFYIVHMGHMYRLDEFVARKPDYQDRQGFRMRRGRGRVISEGSDYEKKPKKDVEIEFDRQFKPEVKKIYVENKPDTIYVFSPIAVHVEKMMPKAMEKRIVFIYKKDLMHKHPFETLKSVKNSKVLPKVL